MHESALMAYLLALLIGGVARQCAFDIVRVDVVERAFYDVGQGGDTQVGVEAPIEGRALMVEQIEKCEWLQDLAEVGRAHQACGEAVRPATGATRDLTYRGLRSRRGHLKLPPTYWSWVTLASLAVPVTSRRNRNPLSGNLG
jgi:hypothetical protein